MNENSQPSQPLFLTLASDINVSLVNRLFATFNTAVNSKALEVHLLMQSNGGYLNDGFCLYNYLRNLPLRVVMYNAGTVQSAATIAWVAGVHRTCSASATFMIHRPHVGANPGTGAHALKMLASNLVADAERMDAIYRSELRLTEEQWDLYTRGDLVLNAGQALDCGLVHEIADFAPPFGSQVFNV